MAITDNDQVQEIILLVGDKMSLVNKKWWYALLITFIAVAPVYYLAKQSFVSLSLSHYKTPQIIYTDQPKQPLQIKGTGIFDLGNNSYSGYVKIDNIEHDWGVASQGYTAVFKTFGGAVVSTMTDSTFILPSSEKLIVFSRFTADTKPDQVTVTLSPTNFIHKPDTQFNYDLQRLTVLNPKDGMVVSAAITNKTAFTITQINLPVAVFDNKNQIVAVSYTYINDVASGETRSFQYTWPAGVPGAVRAEIYPEINIFDRNIFEISPGVSPF